MPGNKLSSICQVLCILCSMKKTESEEYAEDALFNVVIVLLLLAGAVLGVCM
jgi:hypothetical protein